MNFKDKILKRLTVRPPVIEGESLSSYIFRLCSVNRVSLSDLLNLVNKQRISQKNAFLLDTFPGDILSLKGLTILSGHNEENLCRLSYGVVFNKMHEGSTNKKRSFKLDLNHHIVKDKRRFCIKCLEETGAFKLIWQISGINSCYTHKLPLVDTCQECGTVQPYLHEELIKKRCINCLSSFSRHDTDYMQKCLSDYEIKTIANWLFFLDPLTPLVSRYKYLNVEKTIALLLLAIQNQNENDKFFSRSVVSGLKGLIRDTNCQRTVILSDIINVSLTTQKNAKEILGMEIDPDFASTISSLIETEKTIENCISPWCVNIGSNKSLKKVTSHYQRLKDKYYNLSVCTSCYTRYGYNKMTNTWEDIEGQIKLVLKVSSMLEHGASIREITKVAKSKTYPTIGYVLFFDLISLEAAKRFKLRKLPINNIEPFFKIYQGSMAFRELYRSSKFLFNWNLYELAYYLSSPIVQSELNFSPSIRRKKYFKSKPEFEKRVQDSLDSLLKNEEAVTLSQIASAIDKNPSILRHYSLVNEVKEEIFFQNEEIKSIQLKHLLDMANSYIKLNGINQPIIMDDVYAYLGVHRSFVRRNYLSLDHYISEKVSIKNAEYSRRKIENLALSARDAVKSLGTAGERPTVEKISKKIGVSVSTLYAHPTVIREIYKYKLYGVN
ncbi:TniQ family protein [Neobacillus drentensis]|uniref:TniQ family protein n=1 Tax=Neobacillus drentensis TaxID=220684 RepID=UPI002FFFF405